MKSGQGKARSAVLVAAAVFIYAMSGGIRANFGTLISPLCDYTGMSYANLSFVLGVSQLMYGLSQPFWGSLALKKTNAFVLLCGIPLMMAGVLIAPLTSSVAVQTITFGLMLGSGAGALSFGLIMGAIAPLIGEKRAAMASGILNAGCGIGISAMSPAIQRLSASAGILRTMMALAIPFALLIPVVLWMGRLHRALPRQNEGADEPAGRESALGIFRAAFQSSDYRALMIGFSTCGFHMVILQTHMVSQFVGYGIAESTAAEIYTVYGIATMAGALLSGVLCTRFHLKTVLGALYGTRAAAVALFVFAAPKTLPMVALFAVIMGLTGDATVTPTSQIVSLRFGAAKMGLLFGVTFVCHQIGGFLSSWLGGVLIAGGQVALIWLADVLLCAVAAVVSFRIRVRGQE